MTLRAGGVRRLHHPATGILCRQPVDSLRDYAGPTRTIGVSLGAAPLARLHQEAVSPCRVADDYLRRPTVEGMRA